MLHITLVDQELLHFIDQLLYCVAQVRLGWHDAGTYNKNIKEFPQRGGANGSLRFEIELKHAANAGIILYYTS